jgi:hypothetical protein
MGAAADTAACGAYVGIDGWGTPYGALTTGFGGGIAAAAAGFVFLLLEESFSKSSSYSLPPIAARVYGV